jgi:nucleoside-diphosphate-sugar epimerase
MSDSGDRDNRYRGTRIVVLGAAGFLGRWTARALCSREAKVSLVVQDQTVAAKIFSKYNVDGAIVELDLRDDAAIKALFRQVRPSLTFNFAGSLDRYGDEQHAYQMNAHLVKILCEAIAESRDPEWVGQDIVHAGSALEYGAVSGDLSEDSLPNPTTLYGKSKLAGTYCLTRSCQLHGIKGLTVRLFPVYGPEGHRGRLLPSLLEVARTGKPLGLTAGTQQKDFTYVEDAAEGLLRLGLAPVKPGEIVNLARGQLTSVRRFVETAAEILQIPHDRLQFGVMPTPVEDMDHSSEVTVARLRQLTGWAPPTDIVEGIRKTLDFETHLRAEA